MNIELNVKELKNNQVKLTYPEGIINVNLKKWFSEVVIDSRKIGNYVAATPENKEKFLIF